MQRNNSNEESNPGDNSATGRRKQCKERPWCWLEKTILRTIGDIFDATNDEASARSVYLALSEIASDEQSDTFTTPMSSIARRAGVSYRTVSTILNQFEQLKLVAVTRNTITETKLQLPNTYTLGNSRLQASLPRIRKNL
jgi:hypothetical protein